MPIFTVVLTEDEGDQWDYTVEADNADDAIEIAVDGSDDCVGSIKR